MLQIVIVKSYSDGRLDFEENGGPNNGNSKVAKGEEVHWKVHPQSGVDYIENIKIKTGPGAPPSTNIFSGNPPRPQADRKHWEGTVNANAQTGQEYNYDIMWVSETGGTPKIYDPKLTIKPSGTGVLPGIIGGVVALVSGVAYLLHRRKNKFRNK